jgi:hypothetical protein
MSELDSQLRGLRDDLHATIPPPDLSEVAGRARQRTVRRRVLGAIAAVLVVSAAVPVLRSLPTGTQAGEQGTPARSTYDVDFADADHGYALRGMCRGSSNGCEFTLLATSDGGRTWQRRTLPPPASKISNYFNATLYVLSPDEVVIDRPAEPNWETRRIYSDDGGRDWRVAEPWYAPDFAPVPENGVLTVSCSTDLIGTDMCAVIGTIQPDTGTMVRVPEQPKLTSGRLGTTATAGGQLWVVGRKENAGWTVAVSGDSGRTWTTTVLDVPGIPTTDRWAVVERNGVMYLTAGTTYDLLAVWRSTDDGTTWTRTWAGTGTNWLPSPAGSAIAAGDGSLIVSDGRSTYVSTDQGVTFRRTGDAAPGTIRWTRAGYLRSGSGGFALSTDGVKWRSFEVR